VQLTPSPLGRREAPRQLQLDILQKIMERRD
jgi:hypothetical protein